MEFEHKPLRTRTQSESSGPLSERLTPGFDSASEGSPVPEVAQPDAIDRYRIDRVLGSGAFGRVYLAYDDQLQRHVAIKVPVAERVANLSDAETYLAEARIVASLDHPAIVPVHDLGRTSDGHYFVVSKYIEGCDLAERLERGPLEFAESATIVAAIAEALHHAHRQRLVHRDVKPANILLDGTGKPYLADFGVALREKEVGRRSSCTGTPAYMSPEQARGEAHLVDGRSDVFSLGVVLYELLTRVRPFHGATITELLEHITGRDACPPRQHDERIPRELERICLKALARRMSERYSTAHDMAVDLRLFLGSESQPASGYGGEPLARPGPSVKVSPKGLRSFEAADADSFLELLPGLRNRAGLPESIAFWKTRIDTLDPEQTFRVGLIYGPSGCGKSSLVKAGLLPRLADHVKAVYLEATTDDTEARLLRGLRKTCPTLPEELDLVDTLAALRQGQHLAAGEKLLIVLDQFEQWLHAHEAEASPPLVQALRHTDGTHLQAIVMVRDDFWLAVKRCLALMEIDLLDQHNVALVDLFDTTHARHVLAAIGQGYGRLPDQLRFLSADQASFLDAVVAGLAEKGKIISVRLALFAQMVQSKPWTPDTLDAVGGAAGVGVTFLDETLGDRSTDRRLRTHQPAAQALLAALLPESGSDIKGHMRSHAELLAASGYAERPADFVELLRILDSGLRLITPTEAANAPVADSTTAAPRYYQLTHDYLVPSLRNWLTSEQRKTRRGRARLLLAERSAAWNARPENRLLPSPLEWARIRLLTRPAHWKEPERRMMARADRAQSLRGGLLAGVLAVLATVGFVVRGRVVEGQNRTRAEEMVDSLAIATTNEVPALLQELAAYRHYADPLLRTMLATHPADSAAHLHAALALLPVDPQQSKYLEEQLFVCPPEAFATVVRALSPPSASLVASLREVLHSSTNDAARRFRAGCALASYDAAGEWGDSPAFLARELVATIARNPGHFEFARQSLQPIAAELIEPLATLFRDADQPEINRAWATELLKDYAASRPDVIANLAMDAESKPFGVLFPLLAEHQRVTTDLLRAEAEKQLDANPNEPANEVLASRQANAAVALLRLGAFAAASPVLKHSPDPRARSLALHRLSSFGVEPATIAARLDQEREPSIRRTFLLALGEYDVAQLPESERKQLAPKLLEWYRLDPDAGIHAAAEWTLRRWGYDSELLAIDEQLAKRPLDRHRQWYVSPQQQTFVVFRGSPDQPIRFQMGSPTDEPERQDGPMGRLEELHEEQIPRSYALSTHELTLEELMRCPRFAQHDYNRKFASPEGTLDLRCPATVISWFMAVEYCNWLTEQELGREAAQTERIYEPNAQGKYADGMRVVDDWRTRSGYRLPTEAEWEYACRAGTITSRYYGPSEGRLEGGRTLLGEYAWYTKNSRDRWLLPVASMKPNDAGLFDMLGNAYEWCQGAPRLYSEGIRDDGGPITGDHLHLVRGAGFYIRPALVRSAYRNRVMPSTRYAYNGFRVARTIP